ncbi:uroporphyrinogen-III synthase [Salimicrobium album]|uniref:Uroporphyrinogen-III synthase n=1 Tax=Salimicrobium album TaxID=50717 RepID=A0A1H3GY44_9BACI|nr:uroporphyrinogen-III synthase [Salimicrobium album]SDY08161.1 uroporphyrinogen-III synthase [Salimicrobium album]
MNSLNGKRIAIAADRRSKEMGALIENFGGTPVYTPLQGEQQLHEKRSIRDVHTLLEEDFEWIILTTGIGVRTLKEAAQQEGMRDAFLEKLQNAKLAIRGKKALGWLLEHELTAEVVSEDGTMKGLMEKLEKERETAFLQAYSVDDASWKESFEKSFSYVYLSRPYEYKRPSIDIRKTLIKRITNAEVQAVLFTSKTQVRNLFEEEADDRLVRSLNNRVKAVATGKVTAEELRNFDVQEVLYPQNQKMGAMVVEMARYFDARNDKGEEKHA